MKVTTARRNRFILWIIAAGLLAAIALGLGLGLGLGLRHRGHRQEAQWGPTVVASFDGYNVYLEQTVDHFAPESTTWSQQFYINSSFWKPGAPMLFYGRSCMALLLRVLLYGIPAAADYKQVYSLIQ